MSGVFKKLKGTFQNAQQDIVEGLRALTTSLDAQPRHEQLKDIRTRQISLDAGADLLHSYQKVWSEMQMNTKESAKKAEEVRVMMQPLFKMWDDHTDTVTKLEEEVKAIPNVIASLKESQNLLDSLRQDFVVAEKAMDMLENLCEEMEQQALCRKEEQRMAKYRTASVNNAQRFKVKLAQSHARKIAEVDTAKRASLQDRAEAFTSAFQEDVNYYKTHGHPDRASTEFPKVTSLSEIEIEEDKKELDSFLDDEQDDDGASGDDQTEEGNYFEDDYTTDFAVQQDDDSIDERDLMPMHEQLHLTKIDYEDEYGEEDGDNYANKESDALDNNNDTSKGESKIGRLFNHKKVEQIDKSNDNGADDDSKDSGEKDGGDTGS